MFRRLAIIAVVLAVVGLGAAGAWWMQRNPAPEKLVKKAQEELAAGNVDAAYENLRRLERQQEAGGDKVSAVDETAARDLRVEVLRAQAANLLAQDKTGEDKAKDGRPLAAKALGKLTEAMQLQRERLDPAGSAEDWRELLDFEETRLLTIGGATQAAEAKRAAAKRLSGAPQDERARRVLLLAEIHDAKAIDAGKPRSERLRKWEMEIAQLNAPDIFLRLFRGLMISSFSGSEVDQKDVAEWALGYASTRELGGESVEKWRFCKLWTEAATGKAADDPQAATKLTAALLNSVDAEADWRWLEGACKGLLDLDRRPVWDRGHLTIGGAVAVSAVLEEYPEIAERPTLQLLLAQTVSPAESTKILQGLIDADTAGRETASIWGRWAAAQVARQGLPGSLVEAVLAGETDLLPAAKEAVGGMPGGAHRLYLEAYLMLSEGNWYPAIERFAAAQRAGAGLVAGLGKAEALLSAGESGAGMQEALKVMNEGLSRLPVRAATRTRILMAVTLMRLREIDNAAAVVEGMASTLAEMPVVAALEQQVAFAQQVRDLGQGKDNEEGALSTAASERLAQLERLVATLKAGDSDQAAALLVEMPLAWGTGTAWRRVLTQKPELVDLFFKEWESELETLDAGLVKSLVRAWLDEKALEPLLAADSLIIMARQRPELAAVKAANLAWSMGAQDALPKDWESQLPERLDAVWLRYKAAAMTGDQAQVSATFKEIERLGKSPHYLSLLRAEESLRNGDLAKAERLVEGVCSAWPLHSGAHTVLGVVRKRREDVEGAVASLQEALLIRPDARLALREAFAIMYETGNKSAALQMMARHQQLYPGKASLERLLGEVGQSADDVRFRAAVQERIVASDPYDVDNKMRLAALYERAGEVERATALAREVLAASPGDVAKRCWLATMLTRQGDKAGGRALIDEAVSKDMLKTAGDWLAVAGFLQAAGVGPAADAALNNALALEEDIVGRPVAKRVAQTLFQLGQFGKAMALLEEIWKTQKLGAVGGLAAECAYRLGDSETVEKWISRIEEAESDWVGLSRLQATVALEKGDEETALRLLGDAIAATPTDPNNFVARARLHQRTGNTEAAIGDYKEALTRAPSHASARLELGAVLLGAGDFEAAAEVFEGGEPIVATHPAYQVQQAALLFQAKRYDEAKEILESLHGQFGDDLVVLQALARLSLAIGDPQQAAKYSRALLELAEGDNLIQRNNLAYWLAAVGETAEATKLAKGVVAEAENRKLPPNLLAQLIDTRGFVSMCSGEVEAAVAFFERALKLYDWPGGRLNLATAQLIKGDDSAAAAALDPVVAQWQRSEGGVELGEEQRLQFLELVAVCGAPEKVVAMCSEVLTGDRPLLRRPNWRARVLAAMAIGQSRAGRKLQGRSSVEESLSIAPTFEGHLAAATVARTEAEKGRALGAAQAILEESPHAIRRLRLRGIGD